MTALHRPILRLHQCVHDPALHVGLTCECFMLQPVEVLHTFCLCSESSLDGEHQTGLTPVVPPAMVVLLQILVS